MALINHKFLLELEISESINTLQFILSSDSPTVKINRSHILSAGILSLKLMHKKEILKLSRFNRQKELQIYSFTLIPEIKQSIRTLFIQLDKMNRSEILGIGIKKLQTISIEKLLKIIEWIQLAQHFPRKKQKTMLENYHFNQTLKSHVFDIQLERKQKIDIFQTKLMKLKSNSLKEDKSELIKKGMDQLVTLPINKILEIIQNSEVPVTQKLLLNQHKQYSFFLSPLELSMIDSLSSVSKFLKLSSNQIIELSISRLKNLSINELVKIFSEYESTKKKEHSFDQFKLRGYSLRPEVNQTIEDIQFQMKSGQHLFKVTRSKILQLGIERLHMLETNKIAQLIQNQRLTQKTISQYSFKLPKWVLQFLDKIHQDLRIHKVSRSEIAQIGILQLEIQPKDKLIKYLNRYYSLDTHSISYPCHLRPMFNNIINDIKQKLSDSHLPWMSKISSSDILKSGIHRLNNIHKEDLTKTRNY